MYEAIKEAVRLNEKEGLDEYYVKCINFQDLDIFTEYFSTEQEAKDYALANLKNGTYKELDIYDPSDKCVGIYDQEYLKEISYNESDDIEVRDSNKKSYKTMFNNYSKPIMFEVRNSNGGLLGGSPTLDGAKEIAREKIDEYKDDSLNKDMKVFIERLKESDVDNKQERIKWLENALVSVYSYGVRACVIDNVVPGLTNKDSYGSLADEYKELTGKEFNIKDHIVKDSELKESYDMVNVVEDVQTKIVVLRDKLEKMDGNLVSKKEVINILNSILSDLDKDINEAW